MSLTFLIETIKLLFLVNNSHFYFSFRFCFQFYFFWRLQRLQRLHPTAARSVAVTVSKNGRLQAVTAHNN
jgi:hypothetical protein